MLKKKLLVAALVAAFAAPAMAETSVSSNVGFASDYIFRGITQNSHNPAVQGGIDYTHDSGLYVGAWGSNVSWIKDSGAVASGNVTMELDTYAGYRGTAPEEVGYDVGFVRYNYLGDYTAASGFAKADTQELYGSVSYKFLTAKYSYSLGDFLTVVNGKGSSYFELNASYTLEGSGVTLSAHAGKQKFKPAASDIYSYTDYKLAASKDLAGYVLGLAYTSTNAGSAWTYGNDVGGKWGKGVLALTVTHAM